MKKLSLLFLTLLLVALPVAAQTYVNFANSGTSPTLSAFFYIDGSSTNQFLAPTSGALTNGSELSFSGSAYPNSPISGVMPLALSVYDDGYATDNTLGYQASFSFENNSGSDQPISAGSLEFGVSGLFALDSGQTLTSTFSFVTGDSTITNTLVTSYVSSTGTFTFTNDQGFTITNGQTLSFTGNFSTSAVPEPSTYAMIAGLGALGLAMWRRRRLQADES